MLLHCNEFTGNEIVRLAERKGWSIEDTIFDMLLAYAGCDTKEQLVDYIYNGKLP
jgi:hypothetical protein